MISIGETKSQRRQIRPRCLKAQGPGQPADGLPVEVFSLPCAKLAHHPVDNRNVLVLDVVHDYLADISLLDEVSVPYRQWSSVSTGTMDLFCLGCLRGFDRLRSEAWMAPYRETTDRRAGRRVPCCRRERRRWERASRLQRRGWRRDLSARSCIDQQGRRVAGGSAPFPHHEGGRQY